MNVPTPDELLADAIAYVAFDLLDALDPNARSQFLRELLGLMARYGSIEASATLRTIRQGLD